MTEKVDKWHRHEALDRCHVCRDIVASQLLGHPAVEDSPEARELIEQALDKLGSAYQVLGCRK